MKKLEDTFNFVGVLFCLEVLGGVLGHPMPNHYGAGYTFIRPYFINHQPSSQNLGISQRSQQIIHYPLLSNSNNSDSQVLPGAFQPHQNHGMGINSIRISNSASPAINHQLSYPQSKDQKSEKYQHHNYNYPFHVEKLTEKGQVEDFSYPQSKDQKSEKYQHHNYNYPFHVEKSTEKGQVEDFQQKPDNPDLSADATEHITFEEDTQTQLPMYDAEYLEDSFRLKEKKQPGESTTEHENVFPQNKIESTTEAPQVSPTGNRTVQYETLRFPNIPTPQTPKPKVLSVQHRNYPIPHSDNPDKYLRVGEQLYYNPELYSHHYPKTEDSIHDSAILPEVKALSQIAAKTVKSHNSSQTSADDYGQSKSVSFNEEHHFVADDDEKHEFSDF